MREQRRPACRSVEEAISWLPLLAGALASYGPVGYNYGFALYFLSYSHGFVKRGLVGELFAGFARLSRGELLGIEYVFLALGFGLTYGVFRRVLFGSAAERRLAAVLLCGPAALPHLGYLFAQPDITLYVLVLLCVALLLRAKAEVAAAASLPLCVLGLLTHEAFSLMFYPLVVAMLVDRCVRGRLRWWIAVGHVLAVGLCFCAVLHWGALKVSPDVVLAEAEARTNVGVQRQVYDVMASTFGEQMALVRRMYTPGVIWMLWLTLALSAPYFVLLVRLLERAFEAARLPGWQRVGTALLFLSPLLLCTLGHDTTRWIGAMCLDATLFLLYLYLADAADGPVRRTLAAWAAGPAAFFWIAYLLAIGPYGATGIRTAEQFVGAWTGR